MARKVRVFATKAELREVNAKNRKVFKTLRAKIRNSPTCKSVRHATGFGRVLFTAAHQ